MRVERVALEHHRDVALVRGDVVHDLLVEDQIAVRDLLEPCNHVEGRGFAAARGAEQDDELAILDIEVEIAYGMEAVGVFLVNVGEADPGQDFVLSNL